MNRTFLKNIFPFCLIGLATLGIYGKTLFYELVYLDDHVLILENYWFLKDASREDLDGSRKGALLAFGDLNLLKETAKKEEEDKVQEAKDKAEQDAKDKKKADDKARKEKAEADKKKDDARKVKEDPKDKDKK